jgi:hypothetical protein
MACFGFSCFSPPRDDRPVPDKIKSFIDELSVPGGLNKHIVRIKDKDNRIHIDGYNPSHLYGENPLWSIDTILQRVLDSDMYSNVTETRCVDQGKPSRIKYTNPDKAIEFVRDQVYEDIPLEELPTPPINTSYSYTYVVVQTRELTYHIRYGKVNDFMELGVKHSILAGQDRIVVSGELAIKRDETQIKCIVNINSSKISKHRDFASKMYLHNVNQDGGIHQPDDRYAFQFYYIFMIQLALGILTRISPHLTIRVPRGTMITYEGPLYNNLSDKDELLLSYYTEQDHTPCPSHAFIDAYNAYGREQDTPYGMCIDKMKEDGYHLIETNGGIEQCRKMGLRRKSKRKKEKHNSKRKKEKHNSKRKKEKHNSKRKKEKRSCNTRLL